jgi:WhiB family redox-sensing transcriptional regulator
MSWESRAACIGKTHIMFPDAPGGPGRPVNYGPALAICARCTVSEQCLQFALDNNELEGVWGGQTPKERKPFSTTSEHGHSWMYKRGCRCVECRTAEADHKRAARKRAADAEWQRKKYEQDPEPDRERRRAYYEDGADYEKAREKARYWADPETARERRRRYYLANREKELARKKLYYARKKGEGAA